MTEKRFEPVLNEFDEVEYIMDKEMMEDRDFADFIDFANEMAKENEQLKQRINSRLHFYRELYETTNDKVVEKVIEDLEDILKR